MTMHGNLCVCDVKEVRVSRISLLSPNKTGDLMICLLDCMNTHIT
jgi:hypothetical protein